MQAHIGAQTLAAAIHRHHVRVVAARHTNIKFPVVRHYQGLDGQAMRRDRREDDPPALRSHQRTSDRQVIGGTAGRRRDDQTVGVIGVQQLAVHLQLDLQHATQTLFENSDLVEGVGSHDDIIPDAA